MGQAALFAIPAVIGTVSNIASGISASQSATKAKEAQQDAINKMLEMNDEQIQLMKDQLDNFQAVFGSVEQNLKNYYNSLSADSVAAKNIQNLEVEFNRASTQLNQQLAQRGLSNSGASVAANTSLATSLATSRAEARSNAASQVANQQLSWYSLGTQQKQAALAGLNNSYSSGASLYGNLANLYGSQANQASTAATQSFSNIGSTVSNAIGQSIVANALSGGGSGNGGTTNSLGLPSNSSAVTIGDKTFLVNNNNSIL